MNISRICRFFTIGKILQAKKFMKANYFKNLMYTPKNLINLTQEDIKTDKLIQTFFTNHQQNISIKICPISQQQKQGFSTISNSYYSISLPLDKNQSLYNKFKFFYGNRIRTGRILQLMDYIASTSAYKYCKMEKERKCSIVTACVDQIRFFKNITAQNTLIMNGYVTYIGKSSAQIQVDVCQQNKNGQIQLLACATFLMVARQIDINKAYRLPELDLTNQNQTSIVRHSLGQAKQKYRKEQLLKSLHYSPPTFQQSTFIHQFFTKEIISNSERIDSTLVQKTLLMHHQDRNLHGKIFGGFIMRQAYELAWLCAYRYIQKIPQIYDINDVIFIDPIQVGNSVIFKARVVYTKQQIIHVNVQLESEKIGQKIKKTDELRLSFIGDCKKSVHPSSYKEAMLFLKGKRAVQKFQLQ